MSYTNSQILAAVVSEWMRPAISQIASSNLMKIPAMQSLQSSIGSLGLVSGNYSLQADLEPILQPVINSLVAPVLAKYFGNIPDASIPMMARSIIENMMKNGSFSILEGMVTFDENDIMELADLLDKNLPVQQSENYKVIH